MSALISNHETAVTSINANYSQLKINLTTLDEKITTSQTIKNEQFGKLEEKCTGLNLTLDAIISTLNALHTLQQETKTLLNKQTADIHNALINSCKQINDHLIQTKILLNGQALKADAISEAATVNHTTTMQHIKSIYDEQSAYSKRLTVYEKAQG